jgi:D-alanyl-D-alanine-carboxypeptidase/D-alanyl-D-alanine-endopeptidase
VLDLLERAGRRGHHSLAVAVVADGETVSEGWCSDGPCPDAGTLFEIGSITKPFTAVLLADMHLRGEVALDDPLSRHLHRPGPAWRAREPTLLELATHRSGLRNTPRSLAHRELLFALGVSERDPWSDVDAARYSKLLQDTSPRRAPGGRLRYSSIGFGLLGDALAAAAGKPFEELLRERVLAPLGMHATTLAADAATIQGHSPRGKPRPPLEDLMPAAGSLRSNLADMSSFVRACLSPEPDPPGPALAFAQRPVHRVNRRMSIGLGWLIVTHRSKGAVFWHNGGTWGFSSFAGFSPSRDRAVVVLANTARSVDRLGWRLLTRD